jgi:hypothetical protein
MRNNELEKSILASGSAHEAMSWLKEPGVLERSLGECSSYEASVELVQDLYNIGAVKVWVFDIDGGPTEEQNSGRLIVELPKSSIERANLLAKCAEIGAKQGFDPEPDYGQRYTIIMLD